MQVPTVLILEPDSLPNLVTNLGRAGCGKATARGYEEGLRLAVNRIAAASPRTALYLDAGNGGWLGWDETTSRFVSLVAKLGLHQHLRGFSTNVSSVRWRRPPCP